MLLPSVQILQLGEPCFAIENNFWSWILYSFFMDSHADTWPKALSLVPTRELGLSNTDLHIWIKRFRPAVCHLQVQPRGQDSKVNQSNYDSLVQLLREKKLVCNRIIDSQVLLIWRSVKFATAAWPTPSGTQENHVLVFPVSPRGLVGAFFPINGIPEMPKPSPVPKPMAMNPFNLPPAVLSHMQQFTPEQRTTIMGQLMHARQQQQQVRVRCSSAIWTLLTWSIESTTPQSRRHIK